MIIFDIFAPPICYACNIRIPDQALCLCPSCKTLLYRRKDTLYSNFELDNVAYDTAVALFHYNFMMRQLIHHFKYTRKKSIGRYFANLAIDILKTEYPDFTTADIAVGVPMLNVRLRHRLLNQAAFLCEYIARELNIPDCTKYVAKRGSDLHQSRLNRKQRLTGSDITYSLKKGANFANQTILLIDDVFTTGATANQLSKFLKDCGAKKIYVLAIASGQGSYSNSA